MKQVLNGLNAYRAEYGDWPFESFRVDASGSDIAIQKTLRGIDTNTNPKKLVFVQMPEKWIVKDRLVDGWGNPLNFWFDGNGDGQVTLGNDTIAAPVAIWSSGPNGRNEEGKGDDVALWKDPSSANPR